ncbi:hypothetical protein JGZ98_11470, partial [Rummeliibacillus suwonensis]|nr:hypothetical protein [Rummeliibacillus suwonensis]
MNIIEALTISADYIHLALKKEAVVVVVEKENETITKYLPGENLEIGYKVGAKESSPIFCVKLDSMLSFGISNLLKHSF